MATPRCNSKRPPALVFLAAVLALAIGLPVYALNTGAQTAQADKRSSDSQIEAKTPTPRILFVGNSITRRHNVPSRVEALAASEGFRIEVGMAAIDGARLRETATTDRLANLLERAHWDVLVLQDYTTTPFQNTDRRTSEETMIKLVATAEPGSVLLYPPWPRAPGHRLYADRGTGLDLPPKNPEDFARRTMDFYGAVSKHLGFTVAPVPEHWMAAVDNGQPVYDTDNYHASAHGADLAAQVLWNSLRDILNHAGRVPSRTGL